MRAPFCFYHSTQNKIKKQIIKQEHYIYDKDNLPNRIKYDTLSDEEVIK